mmetsp:Transcript_95486/g.132644  ORF Transcript_95486/g.132644 Transcript_95486/m.132644 type:complete len:162 (+) Transcript_95486:64-549(+)
MGTTSEKIKGGKIYVKPFNYIGGCACIACGVFAFIYLFSGEVTITRIYAWFAPAYFVIFGLMMIASDLNIRIIIDNCAFLDKYAGRGFFNVFVGSQILEQAQQVASTSLYKLGGEIAGYSIMALGLYLIVLHCFENEKSINGSLTSLKQQAATAAIKSQLK